MPCQFQILDYLFDAYLNFQAGTQFREIIAYLPADTNPEVIEAIKNAEELTILDKYGQPAVVHRLLGWRKVEQIHSNGQGALVITWSTVSLSEIDAMKAQIEKLESENMRLQEENNDLTRGLFEIANLVGGEEAL